MKKLSILLIASIFSIAAKAEVIGSITTNSKLLGSDDRIQIEAFDDSKVQGVACHLSRAVTGGITGDLGLATDVTEVSIACRQVGKINFDPKSLKAGEEVFQAGMSLLFKKLHVVRFYDSKRQVLIYLTFSDKLIDGSPKNSISSVPIQNW